jgi:hypothetical protein
MDRNLALEMIQYWPDNIQAQYTDHIEMSVYDDVLLLPHVIHQSL